LRTEQAVTEVLGAASLSALIQKAVDLSDDPSSSQRNFLEHLKTRGLTQQATTLVVDDWLDLGVSLPDARVTVAAAAHEHKWFKRVDKGRELAALLLGGEDFGNSDAAEKVQALRGAIFAPFTSATDDAPEPEPSPEPGAK
jgi:putative ATP-dependent endonuclease of OLD family